MSNSQNHFKTEKLDDIWLKASVTGSLWASFEIITGSILHNLKIPFAGTLLTFFAVILLISFIQIWPQKGLIWRAGVICALMKSISPSAVILGPMIGIVTEAFIIEFVLIVLGRNFLSYLVAGSLCLLSALLHKILNLIILYGFNLVDIYVNFYNFILRQLGNPQSSPVNLLILLSFIYFIAGSVAAIIGYYIGKKAVLNKKELKIYKFSSSADPSNEPEKQFKNILLIVHLIYVSIALYVFSTTQNPYLNSLLTLPYFLFCIVYYKVIAGRLLKPIFWIQLFILLLLSALFLESSVPGEYSFKRGFEGGYEMLLRAILIITAFSAISIHLRNTGIRDFLIRNGFQKVYMSLQISFNALPVMAGNSKGDLKWIKNPVKSLASILNDAENWLETFKSNNTEL